MSEWFRRNGRDTAQNYSRVAARSKNKLIVKFVDFNTPNPVRVFHTREHWFSWRSNVPEFHVTIVAACRQKVLSIRIKIEISDDLRVSRSDRPTFLGRVSQIPSSYAGVVKSYKLIGAIVRIPFSICESWLTFARQYTNSNILNFRLIKDSKKRLENKIGVPEDSLRWDPREQICCLRRRLLCPHRLDDKQ